MQVCYVLYVHVIVTWNYIVITIIYFSTTILYIFELQLFYISTNFQLVFPIYLISQHHISLRIQKYAYVYIIPYLWNSSLLKFLMGMSFTKEI